MHPLYILLITLLSLSLSAQNQGSEWKTYTKSNSGSDQVSPQLPRADFMDQAIRNTSNRQNPGIVVHQSPELQMLSTRFKLENIGRQNIKGYRVHIFGGERGVANEVKARVSELYPDVPSEISYKAPNYRVRVGYFRTNLDADRFLRQIKEDFGNAFIVQGDIGLPAL